MNLFTYYRSTAAYRIRIALNYKQIDHKLMPINLLNSEQQTDNYKQHNPQGRVPTLELDFFKLGQSSAILEYLEEAYPEPRLLPQAIEDRAWIRYLSQIIISDMHPLNNLSVLNFLKNEFALNPNQIQTWYHHWLKLGFDTLESLLKDNAKCNNFCFGETPTFADICLIPQIYNAHRFVFSMQPYPTLLRIYEFCTQLPYFLAAAPENQPDFPKT